MLYSIPYVILLKGSVGYIVISIVQGTMAQLIFSGIVIRGAYAGANVLEQHDAHDRLTEHRTNYGLHR